MPKEFVHFHIARRTASNLGDSFLGRSARSREPALLLGSVFHDLWFYITGTRPGRLAAVADELHGKDGQDTFWLIKRQAEIVKKYRENPDSADIAEIAAALLVGMLSHLCADATFHPMVYWFSGNYYSDPRAVERHRRLETLMDLAVPADPGHFQLLRMLQATSLTNAYPCEALAELAQVPPDTLATELDATFLRFARVQRLIQLAPLAWLAHLLRPLLPRALRELGALFYAPQLRRHLPLVQAPLHFCHPVTGQKRTTSLETLMDEAATQAVRLLADLEPSLASDCDLTPSLGPGSGPGPGPGPSLDTGLPGKRVDTAIHFAPQPLLPW